ncbi:PREDICTED: uncharacterized protein LOC108780336, partial [Cyphomyrmex costatus]|uniref:uncharacterized protein LOC108780336 n=1 Tax=Cyphomyrmex costatus TaxID=456900 RepID=UPI00085244F8
EKNDHWFKNLSNHIIPDNVQILLQLGENFCLPNYNKLTTSIDFVKHIEHSLCSIGLPKNNTDILFSRADKGNVTVALDKQNYIDNMELLLSDTYETVTRNPAVNKIIRELNSLLKDWKQQEYISTSTYNRLNCSISVLPRCYGLTKIHKIDNPLRIIVSSLGSPLHNLSIFLHKIIKENLPSADSSIINSFTLAKKISNLNTTNNTTLISLDVTSLFTNIPIDLVLDGIENRWTYIE